jgi:hypothetical protein
LFGFLNLIVHGTGLLWTRDQFVAKASTDTGQHNIHNLSGFRTNESTNQAAETYAFDRAATGIEPRMTYET